VVIAYTVRFNAKQIKVPVYNITYLFRMILTIRNDYFPVGN